MNGRNLYGCAGLSVFLARRGAIQRPEKQQVFPHLQPYPHPLDLVIDPHSGLKKNWKLKKTI